jgi:hypothetical protein
MPWFIIQERFIEFFSSMKENKKSAKKPFGGNTMAFFAFIRKGRHPAILVFVLSIFILHSPHAMAQEKKPLPIYVGSEVCKQCHEKEYASFMKYAKKSKSFESIERVKKGLTGEEIKGCYACHTTGYGKPGGFVSEEKTPHLKNAGCEVCHGPGEFHVKTMNTKYIKRRLSIEDCEVCHTSERVQAFRYKPMIHGGAH